MSGGSVGKGKDTVAALSRLEIPVEISAYPDPLDGWKVEAAQVGGDALTAIFRGPHARERATEYAFAKFSAVLE